MDAAALSGTATAEGSGRHNVIANYARASMLNTFSLMWMSLNVLRVRTTLVGAAVLSGTATAEGSGRHNAIALYARASMLNTFSLMWMSLKRSSRPDNSCGCRCPQRHRDR